MGPRSWSNSYASVGYTGGVTGGHRRRILRIRLLRRAYRPVLAQAHVALKPPVTPPKSRFL